MSIKEFFSELNGNRIEGELIKTSFYSLITSFSILGILYMFRFKFIDGFMRDKGFFLFFSALFYALIVPSFRQVKAYEKLPCMAGMMVGMTTGMIAGFLPGFLVASTNGMFYGSIFGMALGITFGIHNGKCCGIMGAMEGIMAGFMGGLMGAMTSFMLLNDNLIPATIIVFIISSVIMFGLNYLIYKEMKFETKKTKKDNLQTFFIVSILTFLTTWMIVYGPKGGVFK